MKQDDLMRQIASRYVESYGEKLLEERGVLEASGPEITPGLDRKVRSKIRSRRGRAIGTAGLIAACLLLMIIAPRFLSPPSPDGMLTDDDFGGFAADEFEEFVEEYDEMEIEEEAEYEAPVPDAYRASGVGGEFIPISFPLPAGFAVEEVEQDLQRTVYHLSNNMLDDVVMTMEYADNVDVGEGMTEILLGPTVAYAAAKQDYNMLALEWDGIAYTLTCKHDVNTLLDVGYNIVI